MQEWKLSFRGYCMAYEKHIQHPLLKQYVLLTFLHIYFFNKYQLVYIFFIVLFFVAVIWSLKIFCSIMYDLFLSSIREGRSGRPVTRVTRFHQKMRCSGYTFFCLYCIFANKHILFYPIYLDHCNQWLVDGLPAVSPDNTE